MSNNSSPSSSDVARKIWMKKIKKMLEDEGTKICVHKVPKRLRVIKPEAYTPQCIGLGPYHHWCEDLYEMEQYKLIASKKLLKECCSHDIDATQWLNLLANSLKKEHICQIHASYDSFLGMDDKAIAWMMVFDSLFLLKFLKAYVRPNENNSEKTDDYYDYMMDRKKPTFLLILQDIIKLENQIPTIVLEHVLSSLRKEQVQLTLPVDMLIDESCKKLNPFKLKPNLNSSSKYYAHLLELLYYLIVPESNNNKSSCQEIFEDGKDDADDDTHHGETLPICCSKTMSIQPPSDIGNLKRTLLQVLTCSKPLKVIGNMVFHPAFKMVVQLVPFKSHSNSKSNSNSNSNSNPEIGGSSSSSPPEGNNKEAPKVDEIEIPKVSQLLRVGVDFCPIDKDGLITSIEFNKKSRKFHLPSITIDDGTEVILRNLVAYESVGVQGPSVLARYTELMNGIIDTAEDVRVLRERRIILSKKKDEDIAQLWNGMDRSMRLLNNDGPMDRAIRDVQHYFDGRKRVKIVKFTKECMTCGWRVSMLALTFLLLVLMGIQSFCDVYTCPRALAPVAAPQSW